MMKINRLLMFGTMPPPVGGVTISVKNLVLALEKQKVKIGFIGTDLITTYDIAHVHSYRPWKRLVLLFLGRLRAKRNVFTIHGMHFDESDFCNRICLKITDGIIVLNEDILKSAPKLTSKPILKVTSLVTEGLADVIKNERILGEKIKPRLLVYAQHSDSFEGEPIYGIPFIQSMLPTLIEKYTVVIVDINHCYPELSYHSDDDVVHFTQPVNFQQLLSEVDVYLRPTSKDGDAISIHESLIAGVPIVASDVVTRPKGVNKYIYLDQQSFIKAIELSLNTQQSPFSIKLSSVKEYLNFYSSLS
jgi:glycosyltransferase involved in cell wall biosynthesis